MSRVLVSGAAGFAGSHIVDELTESWNAHVQDMEIVALDSLTYAGRLDRLLDSRHKSVRFVHHDFRFPLTAALLKQIGPVDYIIHNGAESHVLRSFQNPQVFVESNIIGTMNMLEAARTLQPKKFIYVSTDEVFGAARENPYIEDDPLAPTNPYAATKASGELLAYSYYRSFGLPIIITRTMNMFGERQHPEKFIPMTIGKILRGETLQIHGHCYNGVWKSGTRKWLYARAQASALTFLLTHGVPGEKYNIAGIERSNREIATLIAETLNITAVWNWSEPLGPVHDFRYDLDDSKLKKLGWTSPVDFETSLKQTILWTAKHEEFLQS